MRNDVVLLPGLHGTAALFDAFVALAPPWARCRTIALPLDVPQTFDALADAIEPSLRPLEGFVLFGESFSGPIAARLAARLGRKVSLLVLCNPLVEPPFAIPPALAAWFVRSRLGSERAVAFAMTGGDREVARSVVQEVRSLPEEILRARLETVAGASGADLARFLTAPLLAIAGSEDRVLPPRFCESIVRNVPQAVLTELPVPHLAAQVAPAAVWRAIAAEFETAA
jgi:pimeloyl-[acyl-carrier protein] methyl ester esterase